MTHRILLPGLTRRGLLTGAAGAATLAVAPQLRSPAIAQKAPLKVGLMLPYTGTFAKLGTVHRQRLPPLCRAEGRQARRP